MIVTSSSRQLRRRRNCKLSIGFEQLEERSLLSASPQLIDLNLDKLPTMPSDFEAVGDKLFFVAQDANGSELWMSDGTDAGTVLVKDIFAGPSSSSPTGLTNVNGTLFFAADDGVHNQELWKSDGTEAGTVMVKDLIGDGIGAHPAYFTAVNGLLFFTANDGTGREIWKSDGTDAGTVLIKDILPATPYGYNPGSDPRYLTAVHGKLFFSANDGTNGRELWTSDGTEAGTVMAKDIRPTSPYGYGQSSYPRYLAAVDGSLFFSANDGIHGPELWKSDGTEAGTVLVKDIRTDSPYGSNAGSSPNRLANVGGTLFFSASDGVNGLELWKSDGTEAGTILVKDIGSTFDSNPDNLTAVNNTLFFVAADVNGRELWKSDGTEAGTVLVKDINDQPYAGSYPHHLTNVNGTLFFGASDLLHGHELWKSDGTEAGTVLVKDIRPDSTGYLGPDSLTNVDGTLFFSFEGHLWKSNGTEPGTIPIVFGAGSQGSYPSDLTEANGTIFLPPAMHKTAGNFGRATAHRLAPLWSKTFSRDQARRIRCI